MSSRRPVRRDRGQILALFALSLLVMVAFAGLAVDAGGTFAQRRDQQTAADLASLAAANDYLINQDEAIAVARARTVTLENGFDELAADTAVDVSVDTSNGVEVTVGIQAAHENSFLGVLGMSSWNVSTSASALAGFPDTAEGIGPFVFSIGAFEDDGTPKYQTPTDFGDTNNHAPVGELDFAWTNYGIGNVDTNMVADIIAGDISVDRTLEYGDYIGQYNNGNHTALFQDVDYYLAGVEMPVAVVDNQGNFMGWSFFHVISASGGTDKHIKGYFLASFTSAQLRVTNCAANDCPRYLGSYVLKLSD